MKEQSINIQNNFHNSLLTQSKAFNETMMNQSIRFQEEMKAFFAEQSKSFNLKLISLEKKSLLMKKNNS